MENTTTDVSEDMIKQFRKNYRIMEKRSIGKVPIKTIMTIFDIDVMSLANPNENAWMMGRERKITINKNTNRFMIQHEKNKHKFYNLEDYLINKGHATKHKILIIQKVLFKVI